MAQSPLFTTLSSKSSAPKWSFRGKTRDAGRGDDKPGPGAYTHVEADSTKFTKSPRFGFGSQSRANTRPTTQPGPGQYSPSHYDGSRKCGFGTSVRSGGHKGDMPGPGSYNIGGRTGNEGPSYTQRSRTNQAATQMFNPGPGAYHPEDRPSSGQGASPKWGFGTSSREGGRVGGNPGPGQYDSGSTLSGPQYSLRAKTSGVRSNETPGPGAHGGGIWTQFG